MYDAVRTRVRRSVREALRAAEPPGGQGRHIDPINKPPPEPGALGAAQAEAVVTPEMESFRVALRLGDLDVRTSVLDDLATYHRISPEEARRRALNWEEISVQEWEDVSGERVEFYRSMQSWSFDLMWWAYLQADGHVDPGSVVAFRWIAEHTPGPRHLDFGSGVGATSQLFVGQGWRSTLADLSSTLLDFARFRLTRRGVVAEYVDLGEESLPAGAFDAITAIDTLVHVPDVHRTARDLHAALGPGGVLVANIDIRSPSPETVWHLHDDDLRARYDLQRAGFRPVAYLGYDLVAYRRTEISALRAAATWLMLVSPPRRLLRRLGRPLLLAANAARLRRRASHAAGVDDQVVGVAADTAVELPRTGDQA